MSQTDDRRAWAALDFAPQIRYPFKKWQWFTVNSHGRLARHVLHAQPVRDGRSDRRHRSSGRQSEPPRLHAAGADRRAGLQPHLGHAGQRLRREVQAHDRAVPERSARPRRSTTSIGYRQLDGIDSIVGGDAATPTGSTTASTRSASVSAGRAGRRRARSSSVELVADLLHRPARVAVRSPVPVEQRAGRRRGADALLADRAERPRDADQRDQRDDARGVRRQYHALRTISAQRQLLVGEPCSRRRRLEQAWIHRGAGRVQRPESARSLHQRPDDGAHARQRSAAIYSFNYDVLHSTMLQQRMSGVLQRAVLRDRVRVSDRTTSAVRSATRRSRPITASSCRSRSPASATSRRSTARWAACRANAAFDAGHDSRHRRRRVSPAATCSICSRREDGDDRRLASARRRAAALRDRRCGGRRSICWIAAPVPRGDRAHAAVRGLSLRRRRARRPVRGTAPSRRSPSTCAARIICCEALRREDRARAC